MDGVIGDHAVNHTLLEASELLAAWNDPSSVQADIARSAATICSWLKRLCFQNATRALSVADLLMKLAQTHITLSATSEQKVVPSTKDRVISALHHHEHSIQFWILDCMAEILSSIDPRDTIQEDLDEEIRPGLIKYCFSRLSLAYSVPVQTAAGKCLGYLSRLYLEDIVEIILSEMKRCNSDTQIREFVIVQRAVSGLNFSVRSLPVTIKYLDELSIISSKIDRGVLRSEICLSLKVIMQNLLGGDQKAFLEQDENALAFWNVFARFYRLVGKWAKKAKHAVFCYSFMITCVCVGQVSFFMSSNREDVFKLVMNGLRKEDLRLGCIAIARDYIRDVNPAFFRDDTQLFNNQIQILVANVLPKKKPVLESELSIVTDILVAVGRKHMHFLVNEIAASVLKPKSGYIDSSKCALLSALCIIAYEIPVEMETYNYTLGPLIAAIIEGDSDRPLLCAALLCFPAISHSKWDRVKMTGALVASLTLSSNHEIAASASGALHRFALQNPQTNLLLSLYSLIDVLSRIFQDDLSTQIRIINSVKVMLSAYDELIILNGAASIMVPFECWIAVRHHLEGICLLWLLHQEAWVRKEAWDLLQILGYSGIRQLDRTPSDLGSSTLTELKAKDKLHLLTDYLRPSHNPNAEQAHCSELLNFLTTRYDKFEGIITWTWSIVCENIAILIDKDRLIDAQSEVYPLWKNQFSFLCAGIRLRTVPFNKTTTESYRKDYQTRKENLQFLRQSFVDLHLSSSDLISFSQHVSSLLRLPSSRVWKETRRAMMTMHSSTFDLLVLQLKGPVFASSPINTSSTVKKRPKRNQLDDSVDYYFHERVVELFERVFLNVNADVFKTFSVIPAHLPDFLSSWLSPDNQLLIAEASTDFLISILYWLKPFCNYFSIIQTRGTFSICHLEFDISARRNAKATSDVDEASNDPVLELRQLIFSFISSTAFPKLIAEKKDELRKIGQIASSQAIAALLNMGPILNPNLLGSIMKWLTQLGCGVSSRSSSLLTSAISQALTAVLFHHPSQLLDFLVKACNGKSTNDYYAHAVCNNLGLTVSNRSDFIDKISDQETPNHAGHAGVVNATHPCTILVASLLCQISSSVQIRKRGLQLCTLMEPELGSVAHTKPTSHDSLDVCIQLAYNISANIAQQHRFLMSVFFDAVSFFAYDLQECSVQILLEFCNPWIEQFSALISDSGNKQSICEHSEGELHPKDLFRASLNCGPFVWPVLESFMNLTSVVGGSFNVEHQIGLLWELLGNQEHPQLPAVLSRFVELQFRQNPELCTNVFRYLVRSQAGEALAVMQLQNLKSFQDTVPIQQISSQTSKSSQNEGSVNWDSSIVSLLLLTDVIFEKPEYLRDQLPLVVHSACVLEIESLSNLLMYASVELGVVPKAEEICTPKSFTSLVLKKYPLFAKKWCKLAFDWALQCPDKNVAERSLEFYCSLNVWFDLRIGMHISMQIRDGLHQHDVSLLSKCVHILTSIPTHRAWTAQEWTLYVVLGYSLLSHCCQHVFELGLRLLEKCWQISGVPDTDQIIVDLKPLWRFSSLQVVTAKGFTTDSTFSSTLNVLLMISRVVPEQDPVIDVIVTVTLLAIMIELETRKVLIEDSETDLVINHLRISRPSACEQIENLHRVVIAICSGSAEDIRAAKPSNVNSERSSASHASLPAAPRQSIISTVGRSSTVHGTRRISRQSMISNKELEHMQKTDAHSSLPDAVVTIEDLLNVVPELCRSALHEAHFVDPMFSVELLEDILSSNESGWRKPCLWLLDSMLDELKFEIPSRHFAKLGNVLSHFCHDSDIEIAKAAEIVCAGLLEKSPGSYHHGAFKFARISGVDSNLDTIFHFDSIDSSSCFDECIRFFDGPVSSLIQGLSELYTPAAIDNTDFIKGDKRGDSQDFTDLQSQIIGFEHRNSIETIPIDVEKTDASNNASSHNQLEILVEKSPLSIEPSVDEDSNSTTSQSPENSLDRRRRSLPVFGATSSTLTSVASELSIKDRIGGLLSIQKPLQHADIDTADVIVRAGGFEDDDSDGKEVSMCEIDTDDEGGDGETNKLPP